MSELDALNPMFGLPDMGDYYYDAPDQQILWEAMDDMLNPVRRKKSLSPSISKFYLEDPPAIGYNDKTKSYTFGVSLGDDKASAGGQTARGIKIDDGDTIRIDDGSLITGDDASDKYLKNIHDDYSVDGTKLSIRFAGMDCLELPHFENMGTVEDFSANETSTANVDEAIKSDGYVASRYQAFNDNPTQINTAYDGSSVNGSFYDYSRVLENADYMKMSDGRWHQYFDKDGCRYVLVKSDANDYDKDQVADAGLARDVVVNAINNAEDMRIVVDGTSISNSAAKIKGMFGAELYNDSYSNRAKQFAEMMFDNTTKFTNAGYHYWGLDAYGRAISAVYVKIGGKWINLNKLVIADTNKTEINKYKEPGTSSDAINTSSYNFDAKKYADDLYENSKKFDDREDVQGQIFKEIGNPMGLDSLKKWTVMIGDVVLFVPPTSIRCLTQSKAERMAAIRTKGTMAKSATKAQRILEMDIYFNNDRGINGFKLDYNTRRDKKGAKMTYWMNGVRALYAEFRITPFLPIDNEYINEVLGIDAVTMVNFSCETVPNFPRLLKATIQMSEFEYRIYMPEIPRDDDDDDGIRNYFSEQINWPLFRFYYQRLIQNGEALKGVKFLDKKYIKSTFGNKTALVPCSFVDPYIKFYIPNKNKLDQMKNDKINRMSKPKSAFVATKKDLDFANDMSKLDNEIDYINNSDDSPTEKINNFLNNCSGDYYAVPGGASTPFSIKKPVIDKDGNITGWEEDDYTRQKNQELVDLMNNVSDTYRYSFSQLQNKNGDSLCSQEGSSFTTNASKSENGDEYTIKMSTNVQMNARYMSDDDLNQIKTQASAEISEQTNNIFNNRSVSIPISMNFKKVISNYDGESQYAVSCGQNSTYAAQGQNSDTKFLKFCTGLAESSGGANAQEQSLKGSYDYVDETTIDFVPYNDDTDFLVESMQLSTSNTFSQITLQDVNGFAPQYMGGTDVQIRINLTTANRVAAAAIHQLPYISAEFAREYNLVLKAWPLRIETEFTKLFGITDVMVDTVEVDTVPNMPGVYRVQMVLVSVDRSLRNREALTRKDMQNFHNLSIDGVSFERRWNYDQMSQFFSQAELYPDLELPTLAELAKVGYSFIRYSNKDRVYPDPDFYFTYSYVLVSAIIREAVLNALGTDLSKVSLHGSDGRTLSGKLGDNVNSWDRNFNMEKGWNAEIQSAYTDGDSEDLLCARVISDFTKSTDKDRDEVWTVAPNIKVAFGEKRILNNLNDIEKRLGLQAPHGADMSEWHKKVDTNTENPNANTEAAGEQQAEANNVKSATAPKNEEAAETINAQSAAQNDQNAKVSGDDKADNDYDFLVREKQKKIKENLESKIYDITNSAINAKDDTTQQALAIMNAFNMEDMTAANMSSGDFKKWLDAAADAICSNQNIDFSPSLFSGAGGGSSDSQTGTKDDESEMQTKQATGETQEKTDAEKEASQSVKEAVSSGVGWKHKNTIRARCLRANGSPEDVEYASVGAMTSDQIADIKGNAIRFGFFDFKYYTPEELKNRFGDYGKTGDETDNEAPTAVPRAAYCQQYLADPYYRYANEDVQQDYVWKCCTDYNFAKQAFLRICLMYLQVMISYDILPSFAYDIFRDTLNNEERLQKVINTIDQKRAEKAAKDNQSDQYAKMHHTTSTKWEDKAKKDQEKKKEEEEKKKKENTIKNGDAPEKAPNGMNYSENDIKYLIDNNKDMSRESAIEILSKSKTYTQKVKDNGDGTFEKVDANDNNNKGNDNGKDNSKHEKKQKTLDLNQKNNAHGLDEGDTAPETDSSVAAGVSAYKESFDKNKKAIDNGKLFVMLACGVIDGNASFLNLLNDRDYDTMQAISQGALTEEQVKGPSKTYVTKINSFIRALAGEGVIDDDQISAGAVDSPAAVFAETSARNNVAAAADDPTKWLVHSFYDMVVHDCRGRMLRAFPTFYMVLIDEGRKIGRWKLHDNFYNVNSISKITISSSRKMPTDTAEIIMSNFFNTYTTDDEDLNQNYTANFTDVFRSLWLPTLQSYAVSEEQRRTNAAQPERFRLRAGARVHVRIGYGSDASHLPISFNGMIAELETGSVIKLICQSDGCEIAKPILLEKEAYALPSQDEAIGIDTMGENGATPKTIMRSLLNYKGGFINSWFHKKNMDDLANMFGSTPVNPLGIYHFGNPDYKLIGDSETMQNILEVGFTTNESHGVGVSDYFLKKDKVENRYTQSAEVSTSDKLKDKTASYLDDLAGVANTNMDNVPKINFEVFGKTVWDVLNICKSVDPSYMCGVRNFNMRSTIFLGRPHDYYAYDYEKCAGSFIEKRKPYSQYHIYTSFTDIISDHIAVSTKDIKTCAIGLYEVSGFMNAKVQKRTDPQWVDVNIYPEYQRTMLVDTKLFGEPSRKLGALSDIGNWFTGGITNSWADRSADDKGDVRNHHSTAVKMTIDALKTQMKEMYQGQLTIIGDPTVKPNDRMIITDTINGINGQTLVRDVVHVFSSDDGFKTVITPDLITSEVGVKALDEMRSANMLELIARFAAVGISYGIMRAAARRASEKLGGLISKEQRKAAKDGAKNVYNKVKNSNTVKGLGNLGKKAGGLASGAGKKLFNMLGGEAVENNKALKAISKKMSGKFAGKVSKEALGKALASVAKVAVRTCGKFATLAGTVLLGTVMDVISSKIQSRKRLVIFPLTKYKRPMVGGIDGNVGTVYGSPNFNAKDGFQQIISKLPGQTILAPVADFFFGSDSPYAQIDELSKSSMDRISKDEGDAQLGLQAVNNSQLELFSHAGFNPSVPRIKPENTNDLNLARKLYGVEAHDPDTINNDSNFKKMVPAFDSENLKRYANLGYYRVIAREKGFTSDIADKVKCIYLKDKNDNLVPVNAVVDASNNTIDIPYLHKDALGVLSTIIDKSFSYMAGTEQQRDLDQWYADNATSFVTLTSALVCGSDHNFENTGFSFVLTCSDSKSLKAVTEACDQINKIQSAAYENCNKIQNEVLTHKEDGNEVYVLVYPPKEDDV